MTVSHLQGLRHTQYHMPKNLAEQAKLAIITCLCCSYVEACLSCMLVKKSKLTANFTEQILLLINTLHFTWQKINS